MQMQPPAGYCDAGLLRLEDFKNSPELAQGGSGAQAAHGLDRHTRALYLSAPTPPVSWGGAGATVTTHPRLDATSTASAAEREFIYNLATPSSDARFTWVGKLFEHVGLVKKDVDRVGDTLFKPFAGENTAPGNMMLLTAGASFDRTNVRFSEQKLKQYFDKHFGLQSGIFNNTLGVTLNTAPGGAGYDLSTVFATVYTTFLHQHEFGLKTANDKHNDRGAAYKTALDAAKPALDAVVSSPNNPSKKIIESDNLVFKIQEWALKTMDGLNAASIGLRSASIKAFVLTNKLVDEKPLPDATYAISSAAHPDLL